MAVALVFVDFSEPTTIILRVATDLARSLGLSIVLMHVSTPEAETEGDSLRADVSREGIASERHRYRLELESLAVECRKLGVDANGLLVRGNSVRGNPVPKMLSELKRVKPTLIIMGTHQHGRLFEGMFGSSTSKIIHEASCPILLIPSQNRLIDWPQMRSTAASGERQAPRTDELSAR